MTYPKLPEIPYGRYTNKDFFSSEMDFAFRKSWFFVAHASELKNQGDYLRLNIPFASVFLMRGKDRKIRAFLNSCRHRGAALINEDAGCAKVLTCPYHAWSYDLSGKLIGVTRVEEFPGLVKENNGLYELRCEQWGALVFINFDSEADPLIEWLPHSWIDRYSCAVEEKPGVSMRRAGVFSMTVNCNWKMVIENFWEVYHVPFIHPKSVSPTLNVDLASYTAHSNGHGTFAVPLICSEPSESDPNQFAEMRQAVHNMGKIPGIDAKLEQDLSNNLYGHSIFPSGLWSVQGGTTISRFQVWPIDVDRSLIESFSFIVEREGAEFPLQSRYVPDNSESYTTGNQVLDEDLSCLHQVQRSMEGNPNGRVVLGSQEILIYNMHSHLDECIGQWQIPASLRVPKVLDDLVTDNIFLHPDIYSYSEDSAERNILSASG